MSFNMPLAKLTKKTAKAPKPPKLELTPLEKLIKLRNLMNGFGSFCGVDCLRSDYKLNLKTKGLLMAIVTYITFTFYTLFYFRGNGFKQLQTLCVYGLIVAGLKKLSLAVTRHKDFYAQYLWLESLFLANQSGKRQQLLNTAVDDITFMAKFMIAVIAFAVCFYGVYPAYLFLFKGEKELIMNILVPGINHETMIGYLVTSGVHLVASFYGVSGTMTFDFFMQISICGYSAFIVLLEESLNTLSTMWLQNKRSLKYRRAYLRNILIAFQDAERYICQLNDLIYSAVMFQVASLSVSMALCLFCVVVNDWIGGVGYFLFVLSLFMSMSYLGTIIQTANEKLHEIVYASHWYLLPIEEQKMILNLLVKTQNCTELWIGPFAPLNVESGLAVLKVIYQMFMMMLETLKEEN